MSKRIVLGLAVVLLVAAGSLWIWKNKKTPPAAGPSVASSSNGPAATAGSAPAPKISPPKQGSGPADATSPATQVATAVTPGAPMTRTTPKVPGLLTVAPPAPAAPPKPERFAEARADIDKVSLMFRDYRTRFAENPVGSNAEIMKAIMGGNRLGARLGPPDGQGLNEKGELVDQWGTPYFFHQLSKTHMEIRSAGPDRIMWTGDDVVGR